MTEDLENVSEMIAETSEASKDLLSRSSLEPVISLDPVGTKLYCVRARVYCYHCLYIILLTNPVRRSEELRGGPKDLQSENATSENNTCTCTCTCKCSENATSENNTCTCTCKICNLISAEKATFQREKCLAML